MVPLVPCLPPSLETVIAAPLTAGCLLVIGIGETSRCATVDALAFAYLRRGRVALVSYNKWLPLPGASIIAMPGVTLVANPELQRLLATAGAIVLQREGEPTACRILACAATAGFPVGNISSRQVAELGDMQSIVFTRARAPERFDAGPWVIAAANGGETRQDAAA